MTTRRALVALVALGLSLSACATKRSLDASSHAVKDCAPTGAVAAANVGATTRIASEGMIDVEVTVGAAPSVSISCDPELLPHIHVESRGDLLRIWTDSDLDGDHEGRCVALVGSPHLLSFQASGSGDGRILGRAEEMDRVVASGSGDVVVRGRPAQRSANSDGSGSISFE